MAVAVALVALLATALSASATGPRLIRYLGANGAASWSPNGALLATWDESGIAVRAGGQTTRIGAGRIGYLGFPCECPLSWNTDSTSVLFLSHPGPVEGDSSIGEIAPDGSGLEMQSLGTPVGDVGWGPAGFPLAFVPNSRTFDVERGYVGPNPDLWTLDAFGAPPRKLLAESGVESAPLFSPDGSRILYGLSRGRSNSLRLIDADGSHRRVLVPHLYGDATYSWSPDGTLVALVASSRRDRRAHLYIVSAAGGKPRRLTREGVRKEPPAWSPDGGWIAFTGFDDRIREVRPDGSAARTLRAFPGLEVRGLSWSPDGGRLAYMAEPVRRSD